MSNNGNLTENILDDMLDGFEGLDFGDLESPAATEPKVSVTPQAANVVNNPASTPAPTVAINSGMQIDPSNIDALAQSGHQKLMAIKDELNALFVERENVVKDALRALVIGQSMLLLGPPGTGKLIVIV